MKTFEFENGKLSIGKNTFISDDVTFSFSGTAKVTIGDYCTIGPGVKFIINEGDVVIDDWTSIHDRCLIIGGIGINIGQHCWFGQGTVIDGSGKLNIANGVRVGMNSQIWTHVGAGEQIEGCTLFGMKAVSIEDDAWLVGSCTVSPGITIGTKVIALSGSNITKSVSSGKVVAGSPATPKDNLNFYRPMELDEKWKLLENWLDTLSVEKMLTTTSNRDTYTLEKTPTDRETERIIFCKQSSTAVSLLKNGCGSTICDLEGKRYKKRYSSIEHLVLKYLSSNKARFLEWRE